MPSHSLAEIEKTLTQLWMNKKAREKFLAAVVSKQNNNHVQAVDLNQQIDKDGVSLYAQLLNFGHQDLMLNIYPYCAKLLDDKWIETVDDYLEKYPPSHFNFNKIASRFSEYLAKFGISYIDQFPFIVELAHYEWLELELLEQDADIVIYDHSPLSTPEDFAAYGPVVNPVLKICYYDFPITEIIEALEEGIFSSASLSESIESSSTAIAVYRDPKTHKCRFLDLDEMTSKIIEMAMTKQMSYQDLVIFAVKQSPNIDPQKCVLEFIEMVENLQESNLFVGSKAR